MSSTYTTCPYCGVGCGVVAKIDGEVTMVHGDKTHPANFGRLCSKGSALANTLSLDGRLLYPEINGESCSWDTALNKIASEFEAIITEYGSEAIAFYASGQLLTEDYYVANKFMKGFIGTANIDTNSRLCMSSSAAGYKRAFGSDTVPGNYEDLEQADLLVLVGTNLAWCHPILFQRIVAAKEKRPDLQIIVIDPRYTATCEIADLHLAIKAGRDSHLFNGLLDFLRTNDYLDYEFLENATEGFASALEAARLGVKDFDALELQFFELFAKTEKVVTIYSQGVNQSSSGTDKVNSIINCHLATGRIGKPGMGPFSVTGQPNAMGGREVGAFANQLASHMDFEPEHRALVQEFWQSPSIAEKEGFKAIDLFKAINDGKIKALWIMATNPLVSMPNSKAVKQALEKCDLVIVSDCVRNTDTTEMADILLPALAWGEKDGTATNSERRISRQRAFLSPPGEAQADWWIISQVARRMGFSKQFNYQSAADIFREYAALSGYKNNGTRDFDISGLALSDDEYRRLKPIQWPFCSKNNHNYKELHGKARMFADRKFYTASGKAQFITIIPRLPANLPDIKYPFILNTGRIRDQWHTMTRTSKSARLLRHIDEPYAEISPDDAQAEGINDGSLVEVTSHLGRLLVRAKVSDKQKNGNIFIPIHWSRENSSAALVDSLIMSNVDPVSGQPEFKYTPVRIAAYHPAWQGFLLSKNELSLPTEILDYWVKIRSDNNCWRYELASNTIPENWADWVRKHFGAEQQWLEYQDVATGSYRCASIVKQRLNICLFISRDEQLPISSNLIAMFARNKLTTADRLGLLIGQIEEQKDHIICSCFNVGTKKLIKEIKEQNLTTTQEISDVLQAGSNCGSCIPELKALLSC